MKMFRCVIIGVLLAHLSTAEAVLSISGENGIANQDISTKSMKSVSVDLFYESLCPGCRLFIVTQLFPTYFKLRGTNMLNITLWPYGNAHEAKNQDGSWNFTCQHGPEECQANLIEACIIQLSNFNSDVYMPVISCIESSDTPITAAPGCVLAQSKLSLKRIRQCVKGPEGNKLMHEIAEQTDNLQPKHRFVPWILINGVHNDTVQLMAQKNLFGLVCSLYDQDKPIQCKFEDSTLKTSC